MLITNLENKIIKKCQKLHEKKYRDRYQEFLIEGEHIVIEAKKTNLIKTLIVLENTIPIINHPNTIYVTRQIMQKISTLTTIPTICAICSKKEEDYNLKSKILLLDDIQDPGNLGTIIRSSLAFDVDTIVLSNNSVDLYNPKVIRATQGMIFHINIVRSDLISIINIIKKNNIPIYTTSVTDGINLNTLIKNKIEKYALIMGNEGNGVKTELNNLADKKIYIKMNNQVESLNLSVATSIILYELGGKNE